MGRNFDIWKWFELENNPELYKIISDMIEIKLKELLPQLMQECLRKEINNLSFGIQPIINGKSSVDIKDIVANMIIKELQK